jgi:hypothetical protein
MITPLGLIQTGLQSNDPIGLTRVVSVCVVVLQHRQLGALLVSTAGRQLVEHTTRDDHYQS